MSVLIEQCLNNLTWIEAGLLFGFHWVTKEVIFPGGNAEQDVSYCPAPKGLLCHYQTNTNPWRIDNNYVIYPHLCHGIINTLSHQKHADIRLKMAKGWFFTIKELVSHSKISYFSTMEASQIVLAVSNLLDIWLLLAKKVWNRNTIARMAKCKWEWNRNTSVTSM